MAFEIAVTELGDEGQGPLPERAASQVVAKEGMSPGDTAEYQGLSGLIADVLVKAERPFAMTEGISVLALNLG